MTSLLHFKYESTDLNQDEAEALMSLASNKENLIIDLSKVINVSARSATEMFSLAVEHKNPALASLAARLAMGSNDDRSTKPKKNLQPQKNQTHFSVTPKKPHPKNKFDIKIDGSNDELIDFLLQRQARWVAGVVSILTFAPGKTVNIYHSIKSKTLKELAIDQTLELANQNVNYRSIAFKGFNVNPRNGSYIVIPNDGSDVDRRHSFFTCPTYSALREGLIFCKANDLVTLEKGLSVGSFKEKTSVAGPPTAHLQRTFWKISLSPKGEELIKHWNDSVDFLVNFWGSRLDD